MEPTQTRANVKYRVSRYRRWSARNPAVPDPWPGLAPFDEAAARFFNGRSNETAELCRLVQQAPLTVLFGASGLGKTSLIQAGPFALLRQKNILPIHWCISLYHLGAQLRHLVLLGHKKDILV